MFSEGKWFNPGGGFDPELIGNSVWLDGSADFLHKELGAKTRTRAVIGTWIQKTGFSNSDATIFSKKGSSQFALSMMDQSSKQGKISIFDYDGSDFQYVAESTSMLLRDIGWYHIMISIDTTASAGSRLKYYINGIDQTSTLTVATDYTLNDNPSITGGSSNPTHWGVGYGGTSQFNPCYLAQSFMLDDDSIQNSDVAVSDVLESYEHGSSSQFGPRADNEIAALATAAGGHSFCLDFANSSALGNDIGDEENDFSVTSMSAANQSTNTPSLVYQTFNPLWKSNSSFTLTEGNTKANLASGGGILPLTQTIGGNEKVYVEFVATDANNSNFALGIAKDNIAMSSAFRATGIIGWESDGDKYTDGSQAATDVRAWSDGAVLALALDMGNRKLWIRDSTGWQGSSGTDNPEDSSTGVALPSSIGDNAYIIFGNSAGSSDQDAELKTEANSPLTYAVPSGFVTLNSANQTAPNAQGVDHFATTLAQEGSLFSGMGTAESAYSATLRIYKSRASASASETWGYSFSHDSSNEYTLGTANSALTYGSIRSLSGTDNWVGYSLNISATAGTAAGSQAHSNGSDTTVTHSLNSSRYIVLLFSRSGGDIFYYHPDLASGNLLKFNSSVLPFSSTVITDITTNSFDIGSAAASATYDYLVLAETPGVTDVFSYTGNGNTNGPYLSFNAMPEFMTFKLTTTHATEHIVLDQTRSPINDADIPYIMTNQLSAESNNTTFLTDFLAGGVKIRNSSTDGNFSGGTFVGWSFGKIAGNGTLSPVYGK